MSSIRLVGVKLAWKLYEVAEVEVKYKLKLSTQVRTEVK
jgi:hypothetical protein